jgi:endonuclease YncB( thermonuclease family)
MPFTLIKGRFVPSAGVPDGDSVRFRANDNALWKRLEGRPPKMGEGAETKGTVQLRLEGIDAIEKGATKPLATQARDHLFQLIGSDEDRQDAPGYLLARMTDDLSGRPICFAFGGATQRADGSEVRLEAAELRRSVNYRQMLAGFAYPLYYNTLFASLRDEFSDAYKKARQARRGYWPEGRTTQFFSVRKTTLDTVAPIWPKLWRRLEEYFRKHNSLSAFWAFLDQKNERIDVLDVMEERGLQDLVEVRGSRVRLLEPPENLRVRGKAGRRNR